MLHDCLKHKQRCPVAGHSGLLRCDALSLESRFWPFRGLWCLHLKCWELLAPFSTVSHPRKLDLQHSCCDSVHSHLLIRQNNVCWNLQTLCWLRPDALQDLSCICVPLCLLDVVMLVLWVFFRVSVLCGQLLCFFRDHDDFLASKAATSPIIIFKARCEKAEDYTKRKHVFRWCVWIVWLLAVCSNKSSGYFHLLQEFMWANDSHCYCVGCAMPQAVGHYPVPS